MKANNQLSARNPSYPKSRPGPVGVDEYGFIVAHCATESRVDDANALPDLLSQVSGAIDRFTADGAYDKTAVYDLLTERGAEVVVPPVKNARVSKSRAAGARARNANVESVRDLGRRQWKKRTGYHRQARVENVCYRYKQLIGGRLRNNTSPKSPTT